MTATVKVYELLGAEVNLHYDIADTTCTAKVNPRTTARPGDVVKFAMDIARLHVFDKETEADYHSLIELISQYHLVLVFLNGIMM